MIMLGNCILKNLVFCKLAGGKCCALSQCRAASLPDICLCRMARGTVWVTQHGRLQTRQVPVGKLLTEHEIFCTIYIYLLSQFF